MSTRSQRAERVSSYVETRVGELQAGYRANKSAAVADLARLRRGVGTAPGSDLDLLALALAGAEASLFDDIRGLPDEPTAEEQAAYAAVTLYALHQQSRRDASMHRKDYSLGRSARLLGRHGNGEAVRARFSALGTATTWDEAVHHARGLLQQFRQNRIPLDYGQFARDLFELRGPNADRVRLRWGRDFYRLRHPEDDAEHAPGSPPASLTTTDETTD